MKTSPRAIGFVSSYLVAVCLTAQAQDWPQYLGENRAAKAAFTAPQTWPKELTPTWKVTVGDGVATPALVGDKLYVFSRQEGGEILRCLDATTGKELWKADKFDVLPAERPAQDFAGPRSSPTVAEGKIVTLGLRGTLSCHDAKDGKLLWRKEDFKGVFPRFFTSASPVVTEGLCIAALGGGDRGGVIAYDLKTGDERWRWEGEGASYASPVLLTADGAKMVIAEMDKKILGLAVKDGKVLWETPFVVPGRGYNAATPMVDGSTLYYGGSGRPLMAVKITKESDAFVAKQLWQNAETTLQFNTPVLKNGTLFGLTGNNDFFAISKDGQTAWTAPATPQAAATTPPPQVTASEPASTNAPGVARGPESGPGREGRGSGGPGGPGGRGGRGGGRGGYAQLVDAGAVLLALTPASELIAFQPTEKAYTEIARLKVASSPTYAYPVVSGKRIFVKDKDDVTLFTVE
ncbi:MAG: PQQ-like beta-propeller repeat protein [Verrucomicrobiota bacterium]